MSWHCFSFTCKTVKCAVKVMWAASWFQVYCLYSNSWQWSLWDWARGSSSAESRLPWPLILYCKAFQGIWLKTTLQWGTAPFCCWKQLPLDYSLNAFCCLLPLLMSMMWNDCHPTVMEVHPYWHWWWRGRGGGKGGGGSGGRHCGCSPCVAPIFPLILICDSGADAISHLLIWIETPSLCAVWLSALLGGRSCAALGGYHRAEYIRIWCLFKTL